MNNGRESVNVFQKGELYTKKGLAFKKLGCTLPDTGVTINFNQFKIPLYNKMLDGILKTRN